MAPQNRAGQDGSSSGPGRGDEPLLAFLRALADDTRLRILELLAGHELTAAACGTRLGVPADAIVSQLCDLVSRGCITLRRVYGVDHYRISDPRMEEVLSLSRVLALDRSDRLRTCDHV